MARLSVLGRVNLILRVLLVAPPTFTFYIVRGFIPALRSRMPFRWFVLCALVRVVLGSFTALQNQALQPPSLTTYARWIESTRAAAHKAARPSRPGSIAAAAVADAKLHHDLDGPLPDGVAPSLAWLGDRKTATKFVLFFHGGGFAVPLSQHHIQWVWQTFVAGGPGAQTGDGDGIHDGGVAAAILPYTLVPHARQPGQLREAAAALRHLLRRGIRPQDILIGGDSAGGNIALQLLRHLVAPHPDVPAVTELAGEGGSRRSLAGAFIVSPVVSTRTSARSYRANAAVDMLSAPMVARFREGLVHRSYYATKAEYDVNMAFAGPVDHDTAWVEGLHEVVASVYLTFGKLEVFHDDCVALAEVLRRRGGDALDLQVDVFESGPHIGVWLEAHEKRAGEATMKMREWATARFVEE